MRILGHGATAYAAIGTCALLFPKVPRTHRRSLRARPGARPLLFCRETARYYHRLFSATYSLRTSTVKHMTKLRTIWAIGLGFCAALPFVTMAGAHPEPGTIRAALGNLGVADMLKVTYAVTPRLAVMLRTPRGTVTL